ncbi:unnamed protein product [Cuscuta campestris]|uniref:Uncharacterized protein n=1 Tax=Cuscuta campestris TaxID=132261 RepID=A0A484KXD5_9ASTE|nr:unnamed protein product [Cuscuta campestris]
MQTVDRRIKLRNGPRLPAERSTAASQPKSAIRSQSTTVNRRSTTVDRHGDPPFQRSEDQGRPPCQTVDRSEPTWYQSAVSLSV